jgi:hypothetical protein
MPRKAQLDALRQSFQQLAGDTAALRTWQQKYTTRLDAAHKADLAALTQQYAAQRREAEAARRQRDAVAATVLAQESAAIYTLWQAARTTLSFDAGRWEDLAHTPYTPPAGDAPPAALRIGSLRLEGDPGHWDLPALAPLLGGSSLCMDARHSPAAATAGQALLQALLLRLVLTHAPRRVHLTLCEPGGACASCAAFCICRRSSAARASSCAQTR